MTARWLDRRLPWHRPTVIPLSERLTNRARLASDDGDDRTALALQHAARRVFDDEMRQANPDWDPVDLLAEPEEPEWPGPLADEDCDRRPER